MKSVFVVLLVSVVSYGVYGAVMERQGVQSAIQPAGKDVGELYLKSEVGEYAKPALRQMLNPKSTEAVEEVSELSPVEDKGLPVEADELCWAIGPVIDKLSLAQLERRFNASYVDYSVSGVDVATDSEYWVYMGPYASRKESMRQLRQLQQNKIDSYLIAKGEMAEAISLGIFKNKDGASRLLTKYSGKGYSVKLKEVVKFNTVYWLNGTAANKQAGEELYQNLKQDFSKLEKRDYFCKTLAKGTGIH
ncbi:hypothetical protein SIN8267_03363 [Sinobacterium norvegicum]|uniref:SPOR domain-containing protein n=1 Tax=Sinobacterium norvegicum TaxID=1641715 RepID=A0ABM9AJL1_9GAMM|nr:hypothetical protein [Sinobacterium norvegicum]CAH0993221.1 hypothetical protein SIN8267_03363 [Sinobacterium norvegicum]